MKRLILTAALIGMVTAAQAKPAWFIMPGRHDGTVRVVYEPSWNTPQNKPQQIAKLFEKPGEYDAIAKQYRVWDADAKRVTEASQALKDQIAAAEQAAQAAQMEVFLATELPEAPELGAYSNVVIRVENMIDWFRKQGLDLQRPIKPTRATLLISEWIQAQEDAGNADLASRGQTYSVSLLSALLQFDEVGVTIEQVNAAYEYLKATGRYPDRWEVGP